MGLAKCALSGDVLSVEALCGGAPYEGVLYGEVPCVEVLSDGEHG